jgi:hypothetical protein
MEDYFFSFASQIFDWSVSSPEKKSRKSFLPEKEEENFLIGFRFWSIKMRKSSLRFGGKKSERKLIRSDTISAEKCVLIGPHPPHRSPGPVKASNAIPLNCRAGSRSHQETVSLHETALRSGCPYAFKKIPKCRPTHFCQN